MIEIVDFLYIFNFGNDQIESAIKRLRCSLNSIKDQNVNICLSNNSSQCIIDRLSDLNVSMRYIHKPYNGPFSRALTINFGVKQLVTSEYFIVSDIDLIYQKNHINSIITKFKQYKKNKPVRLVTYNYNLEPYYPFKLNKIKYLKKIAKIKYPKYSSNFNKLIKLPNNGGGFAHGNGLIHLESFMKIRGYDEEMIGYGPEDDLFNTRIGKIDDLIYDDSMETATIHLWHPRFHMIQLELNMEIWRTRKEYYNSLNNPGVEDIAGNKNQTEWGKI